MGCAMPPIADTPTADPNASRRHAMAAFAEARADEIAAPLARLWPDLAVRDLRPPEIGLVMLRGRIGGDGAPFNLGEATVTRAVVELRGGLRGYGQRLGRAPEAARLSAIADALWQDGDARSQVEEEILAPIRRRLAEERSRRIAEAAATKVDFFTLVRGDSDV
jgi:alpha-D-ribose 1-methylphosphonate 5-triphosphate synthase subunit PhnG